MPPRPTVFELGGDHLIARRYRYWNADDGALVDPDLDDTEREESFLEFGDWLVESGELKLILPADEHAKVDNALKNGMGVAIFKEDRIGGARMLVTYGKLGADIAGLPPGATATVWC
jgi:hypothetical protein